MKLYAVAEPSPELSAEIIRSIGARINSGPIALHGQVPYYSWRRVGGQIAVTTTIRPEPPLQVLSSTADGSGTQVQTFDQVPSQAPLPRLLQWVSKRRWRRFNRTGRLSPPPPSPAPGQSPPSPPQDRG